MQREHHKTQTILTWFENESKQIQLKSELHNSKTQSVHTLSTQQQTPHQLPAITLSNTTMQTLIPFSKQTTINQIVLYNNPRLSSA